MNSRGPQEHNEVFSRLYPQLKRAADDQEGYIRQARMIAAAKEDDIQNRARHRRADQMAAQGQRPELGSAGFADSRKWRDGGRLDQLERQMREADGERQMHEAREARAARERGGERFDDGGITVIDAAGGIVSADARAGDHFAGRRDIAGIEPSFLPVRTRLFLDAQARNRLPGQRDI